jgi:hypothetical protein
MVDKIRVTFDEWGYAFIVDDHYISDFVSEYFDTTEEAIEYTMNHNAIIRDLLSQ